jgi:signal transduction histidine kinase
MKLLKLLLLLLIFQIDLFASEILKEDEMVVVLHSYSKGSVWTDSIDNGVRTTLLEDLFSHQISSEYLDTKRYVGEEYLGSLLDTYTQKFRSKKIRAFITSDDNAFHFAIKLRKRLELDIPIIFSGVNGYLNYKDTILKKEKNITGVVEDIPAKENFDLIQEIHPKVKKIYFINTIHSASGRYVKKVVQKIYKKNKYKFSLVFLEDMKMREIYNLSRHFPSDSVVLFGAASRDSEGRYYHFTDNMKSLYKNSSRPIYAFFDFFLNHGVVGGVFLSGYDHGAISARMTLDLLSGKDISKVPVIENSPFKTYFDFNILKSYRMSRKSLPENAKIINRPFGIKYFYENFPQLFWLTFTSIVFLSFSLIFLVIILKNKITFERKIIDLNKTLEDRVESRTQQLLDQQDILVSSAKLASVGEMASSIAHEINNPLAIIKMLSKKIQKSANKDDLASLLKMDETIDRIAKIIKSLKLISRDDKGIDFEVICLEEVVLETIHLSESRFKNSGIDIIHNLDISKTFIFANYVQIAQVVINLLNNSFDAVNDLDEKWVRLEVKNELGNASLVVSDSGAILDESVSDKLMDPFFTTKEVGKGTGLGLSISKNIVNKHDGDLYFDKLANKTTFVLNLPLAKKNLDDESLN